MKKKAKPYAKKYKTVMLNVARYMQIVKQAKTAGYTIGGGPKSQLGAWLADASNYYSNAREKQLPLRPAKEKADERNKSSNRGNSHGVDGNHGHKRIRTTDKTGKGKAKKPDRRVM